MTHLLSLDGVTAACGAIAPEENLDAELNHVDCDKCLEAHDEYMMENYEK